MVKKKSERRRGHLHPSVDELIKKRVVEINRRRPTGGDGLEKLDTELVEVHCVEGCAAGGFHAEDLKYEFIDDEGQRVAPERVTKWLQVVSMRDRDA